MPSTDYVHMQLTRDLFAIAKFLSCHNHTQFMRILSDWYFSMMMCAGYTALRSTDSTQHTDFC